MKLLPKKGSGTFIAIKRLAILVLAVLMAYQSISQVNKFRSVQSGTWTSLATWEMSTDGTNWIAASHFPDYLDGAIVIRNGHEIAWNRMFSELRDENGNVISAVDDLVVESGALLIVNTPYSMIIGLPETEGTGITINGTLELNTASIECNYPLIINGVLNVSAGGVSGGLVVINSTGTLNATGPGGKGFMFMENYGTVNLDQGQVYFSGVPVNYATWNDRTPDVISSVNGFTNNGVNTRFGGSRFYEGVYYNGTGMLSGFGDIEFSNATTVIDKISPGAPFGMLELKSLQPIATMELNIELNNTAGAGIGHDLLQLRGSFTFSGTLNVTELATMPPGDYTIVESLQGTLSANFTNTNLPPGYTIQYNSNSIVLVKEEIVPAGHFRTSQSGNWTDPSSWEFSTDSIAWITASRFPDHKDESIRILNGHTIAWNRIYSDARNELGEVVSAVDDLIVDNGATLTVNSSYYLLIGLPEVEGNGITINGSLVINGGSIECNYPLIINGLVSVTEGGVSGSPIVINSSGVLTASGPAAKGFMGMQNYGTVNLDEGDFHFSAAPANYGSWNDRTTGSFFSINGFTNNGIYFRNGGTRVFDASHFSGTGTVSGFGFVEFLNGSTNVPKISPGDGTTSFDTLVLKTLQPITISELNIELQSYQGPGKGHDLLQLRGGNYTLSGTLNVTEYSAMANGYYTIIESLAGSLTGTFSTANLPPGYSVRYGGNTVFLYKEVVLTPGYFRSAQSGDWSAITSWEFSEDNSSWSAATRIPGIIDHDIRILDGHTINWDFEYSGDYPVYEPYPGMVKSLTVEIGGTLLLDKPNSYLSNGHILGYGGTLTINGRLIMNGGVIENNGYIFINGIFDMQGGDISNYPNFFTVNTGGVLNMFGAGTKKFNNFENYGTVNHDGGNFTVINAFLRNYGTWNDRNSDDWMVVEGFVNDGIYNKYGGSRTFTGLSISGNGLFRGYGIIQSNGISDDFNKIQPGDSLGTLEIIVYGGSVTLDDLQIQLGNTGGPGIGHDLLNLRGDYVLAGNLDVIELSSMPTGEYLIIQSLEGTLTGSFNTTNLPAGYSVQYNPNAVVLLKSNPALFRNITINNAGTITEGASGQKEMLFVVRLNAISTTTIEVQYSTVDSTALESSDYLNTSGTLTFEPGRLRDTIRVPVLGDKIVEADEFIAVQLSSPVNGNIIDGNAYGMIRNDDSYPAIIIANTSIREGDYSDSILQVKVRLSASYPEAVSLQYQTRDSTASSGDDYLSTTGTILFSPGDTLAYIPVLIKADRIDEPNEILLIDLTDPVNARLNNPTGRLTITDNDQLPRVISTNINIPEGNTNDYQPVSITVRLSRAYPLPVTVRYTTIDSSATNGTDYQAVTGILTFNPEDTLETFSLPVFGDGIVEGNEQIKLILDLPTNATVTNTIYRINITNDDSYPTINAIAANVTEGDAGAVEMTMKLRISKRYPEDISVQVNSSNLTALSGIDFESFSQQVVFPGNGDTIQTITLLILPDELDELNETFRIQLTDAVNARISGTGAVNATIVDNDPVPAIRIFDSAAYEGTGALSLRISLSSASAKTVSVTYRTTTGTATAGTDYETNTGTIVSFIPGETEKWVSIPIVNDGLPEPSETIVVQLGSAVNGTVSASLGGDASAIATILDGLENTGSYKGSLQRIMEEDVNNDASAVSVRVWPNPSSQLFLLEIINSKAEPVHIQIFDLTGKVLEGHTITGGKSSQIRVGNNWRPGVYILSVRQNGILRTMKLIKTN